MSDEQATTDASANDTATVDANANEAVGGDGKSVDDLPEWAQGELKRLRKENAKKRTDANAAKQSAQTAQQQADAITKMVASKLGIELDEAPSAEKLAAELDASRTSAAEAAREVAVLRAASKAGVDGDAMLDSRSLMRDLSAHDVGSDEFLEALNSAIESRKPAAETRGTRSGTSGNPADGGKPGKFTPEDIEKMTVEEFNKNRDAIYAQYRK